MIGFFDFTTWLGHDRKLLSAVNANNSTDSARRRRIEQF
jgi:hypothetical protein